MTTTRLTIEPKSQDAAAAATTLQRTLREAGRLDVTAADAATVSGLPLATCEAGLLHLAARYPTRLAVHDTGTLRFTFTSLEAPRAEASGFTRFYAKHQNALMTIATTLVVPLMLAAVLANLEELGRAASHVFPGPLASPLSVLALVGWSVLILLIAALSYPWIAFIGAAVIAGVGFFALFGRTPWAGLLMFGVAWFFAQFGRAFFTTYRDLSGFQRALWGAIGQFVLGPAPLDPLEDERRLTALIVKQHGVLTALDLIALFGWSQAQAEAEAIRLLLDYGGEMELHESGALLYRFASMLQRAGETVSKEDLRPCYEREAPSPASFPWKKAATFALVGLSVFSLLGPAIGAQRWINYSLASPAVHIPIYLRHLMMGVVLVPPLVRTLASRFTTPDTTRRPAFLALARAACEAPAGSYMTAVDSTALLELGGEVDVNRTDAEGRLWVHFPRLAELGAIAATARAELAANRDLGAVVHDSATPA